MAIHAGASDEHGLRSAADAQDAPPADHGPPGCMPRAADAAAQVLGADAMPKPCAPVAPSEAGAPVSTEKVSEAEETVFEPSEEVTQLLERILQCHASDIVWIVRKLNANLHPDILKETHDDAEVHALAKTWTAEDVMQRMDTQEVLSVSDPSGPLTPMSPGLQRSASSLQRSSSVMEVAPIVQFSSFMYFCSENEEAMKIDVMRIGNLRLRSKVHYRTVDATAKAGQKYAAVAGAIVFEPDENQKEIHIPILQNDRWETTLEFVVELSQEGRENAMLGFYLYRARVKIIDDDAFPTNKYREAVLAGDFQNVPKQSLLREYFKMVWLNPDDKCSTIKMIIVDQLHNLYFLVELFMNVYLVDYVLNLDKAENKLVISDREVNLIFIVVLFMIPFILLHGIDYLRLNWELSAAEIQRNLLRKFLNYDETSRAQLREGNLIMAMTRDSVKLVAGGYMKLIALARAGGKLFMILVYQFVSPFAFGTTEYFSESTFWVFSFGPLIVLPLLLITFMQCRRQKSTDVLDERNLKEDELIDHVYQTATNYRLIADYHRRPHAVSHFQDLINDYDDVCTRADQVLLNNEYFQKWVTITMVAITTLFLGREVNSPESPYPLGMFLVNLAICNYIGQSWAEIYQVLMSMEQVLPALVRVTWLMNLQTDVAHRMRLNRDRRECTSEARENLRKNITSRAQRRVSNTEELPIDMLNITMKNIQFAYCSKGREVKFNFSGIVDIKQGSLAALVGHRGQGKSTLLKILGGVILPTVEKDTSEDQVAEDAEDKPFRESWLRKGATQGLTEKVFYVPSHLRVLHVSSEPMFFHGSLYENLVFGVPSDTHALHAGKSHFDARRRRVKRICQLLTLQEGVMQFLDNDEEHLDWDEVFSQTQLALLSLARALIANPEMLCIHKPTLFLDPKTSSSVLQLLRHFVEQKGICQDPDSWHLRRPRTCIITVSRLEALKVADLVYLVEEDSIREIQWEKVTPALLE